MSLWIYICSLEHWTFETDSLETTDGILQQLDDADLVIHIGDLSYAVGFGAQVMENLCSCL